jgi:hypothetical protein
MTTDQTPNVRHNGRYDGHQAPEHLDDRMTTPHDVGPLGKATHTAGTPDAPAAPGVEGAEEPARPRPQLVDEGGRLTRQALLRLSAMGAALVVLGALVGVLTVLILPRTYAARAEVLYPISSAQQEPTGFLREDRNLTTQVMVMQNRSLLAPIAVANGMSVDDLAEAVTATVAEGSEILQLEVRDHSRERGLALSQQIVSSYLAVARDDDRDQVRSYLLGQLGEVRTQLDLARDPRQRLEVRLAAQSLADREQSLMQQLDQLTLMQLSVPRPSVVVPSYSAPAPVSPGFAGSAATGALVGAVTAMIAAGVLRWLWVRRAARP